jgi:phage gp29-like protein
MATLNAPARTMTVSVARAPFNDRFARTLGSSLTPQQVTAALSQAELGYMWQQADLLDEVRERDGHLHAELQKRELRVSGSAWELTPPEGSGELGAEIARWCTARLNEIEADEDLDRAFADAITDLMGAVYQGRAAFEVVWERDGRWLCPRALSWIHPRRFAYTTDWRLHLWDASGTGTSVDRPTDQDGPFGQYPGIALDRFPRGKFVVHRPRVRGVYPTREGLGRLLCWWSTFKRFDVRDLLAYAEWAGRGLRVGTYATGKGPLGDQPATPEDVDVLQEAMEAMSSATAVILADTTKADLLEAPNNNDVHDRLAALCNDEISKATVGGTLGSSVSKAGGSRSQGEVHERGELLIAKSDARSVSATLRKLLAPMVAMNFGDRAPVPSINFAVDPAGDLEGLAKRMQIWHGMGGKIGQRSGANALQLPEIEADEELVDGATKAPGAPAATSSAPPTLTPTPTETP